MADIALGQSITGSFTSTDPKDTTNRYYDEYNFTGLDAFRQITINLQRPAGSTGSTELDLINAATGAIIAERITGGATSNSIVETTYPGINYKLRVSNLDLGDYTLSSVSGDKATSIVSSNPSELYNTNTPYSVGTIGVSGTYFPLASSGFGLSDVALASNGQFYGVRPPNGLSSRNFLIRINPSLESGIQVDYVNGSTLPSASTIKDASGNPLDGTIAALEFATDNKLYAIEDTTTGDKLYTIDPANQVATLVGNLPTGFVSQADLVYDAANSRFFAISQDTATSDALWQIPLANPIGATKIGQIGFAGITGLNFENGQLTGFNDKPINVLGANKIAINTTTGVGTIAQSLTGVNSISGASTIFTAIPPTNQAPTGIVFSNAVTTLVNNTSTVTRIKVADLAVTDDGLGTNNLSLTGADANSFEIAANILYLKAGTVLNSATKTSFTTVVNVDDPTVGNTPDAVKNFTLTITPPPATNLPPTGIVFSNTVTTLANNTSTANRVKVADLALTDDGLGTNNLSLTGADASSFEIISNVLYLKAGTVLNSATKTSFSAVVNVDDPTVGGTPDATQNFTLTTTAPTTPPATNLAPTGIVFSNAVTTLANNTSTANRVKIADLAVTDDGVGTNNLSLTGADANSFEIVGNVLYVKAGTVLNSAAKTSFSAIVNVDDPTVGSTPDATRNFTLTTFATTPVPTPPIAGIALTNNFFVTNNTIVGMGINPVSQKAGSKVNEIGIFAVDDATGKIGGVAPGAAGYLKLVTDSAKPIVFSTLDGSFFSTSKREIALDPNKTYQFFEVQDGSIADLQQQIASGRTPTNILFALPDASGNSPIKVTPNSTNDGYKVSVNNDELVLNVTKLDGAAPNIPIGTKSQSLTQGRTLDLSDAIYAGKTLKADIVTKSDAGYNNSIGFYAVEDAIGTIKTAAGTFKPSDASYALEAIKSAVLSAGKTDSKSNQDLVGGKIYAPVVVAQGTLADFVSKNVNNSSTDPNAIHAYFNYIGANPDKLDHFRLLGNNTFGVEDLYGGGDRDFNDVVVSINIKTT
jgi:hypothetical protein